MPTFVCKALLFDLDGTLLDSLPAVNRCWSAWAERHGMEPSSVLEKIHGRRSLDSIRDLRPDLDAEAENLWLRRAESTDTEGVTPIRGALEFVALAPEGRFAVVTSGTSDVAQARLKAVGLPIPKVGVYGEDVEDGKPHPAPYMLAASRLGVAPVDCLVFEDTRAGIQSGKAAGMRVVAVGLEQGDADGVIRDYQAASLTMDGELIRVSF